MKVIDCSPFDEGYYDDWDFKNQKTCELIVAFNEAGVDIIEVGYKSADTKGFGGLFRYCNESLLVYLRQYNDAEYTLMIYVKEFMLSDQQLNLQALNTVVRPAADNAPIHEMVISFSNFAFGIYATNESVVEIVSEDLIRYVKVLSTNNSVTSTEVTKPNYFKRVPPQIKKTL